MESPLRKAPRGREGRGEVKLVPGDVARGWKTAIRGKEAVEQVEQRPEVRKQRWEVEL